MRLRIFALCAGLGLPVVAEAETWVFHWQGSGGYEMTGALSYRSAGPDGIVSASEVDCFVIEGMENGSVFGSWALGRMTFETTWVLSFDPAVGAFDVFGPDKPMPQAWNMAGAGTDCGPEGFGFNIGNAAQDMCYRGELLFASQAEPSKPLVAELAPGYRFPADACRGEELIG